MQRAEEGPREGRDKGMRGLQTARDQNEEEAWRQRKQSGDDESEKRERDAVISTAERKWGCQDKDKLRQREKEIRGKL